MALAMLESDAEPVESTTCSGMTVFNQPAAATPMPLLVDAAALPAVAVPWPSTSAVLALLVRKLQPGTSLETRSSWVGSTPESAKAIVMEGEPVVIFQAF